MRTPQIVFAALLIPAAVQAQGLIDAVEGSGTHQLLGFSVAGAGDVNGDGVPDLVAGAQAHDKGGEQAGLARLHSGRCGSAVNHGAGCGGSGGFMPSLAVTGCISPLCDVTVSMSGGLGGGTAFLLLGLAPAALPFNGQCQLLVAPLLPPMIGPLLLSGAAAGEGSLHFSVEFPPVPLPFTLGLQAFVLDPGASAGLAGSNAVILAIR